MDNNSEVVSLYLDDIIPNRFQPREIFDDQALKELAVSIKEHGVIQPIIVRKVENKYEIIAGERRYKASTMAGLTKIPAIVKNLDDKESSKIALIENLQRKDLTPIEEARTYQKILELEEGAMTQEQLASTMGKTQSSVSNKLRLLALPEEIQDALLKEKISERHARSLLNVEDKNLQIKLLDKIIADRMTVRDLEKEIKDLKDGEAGSGNVKMNIQLDLDSVDKPKDGAGKGLLTATDIVQDQKAASFGNGSWTLQDNSADLKAEEKPGDKTMANPKTNQFNLFSGVDIKKEEISTTAPTFNFASFDQTDSPTTPSTQPLMPQITTFKLNEDNSVNKENLFSSNADKKTSEFSFVPNLSMDTSSEGTIMGATPTTASKEEIKVDTSLLEKKPIMPAVKEENKPEMLVKSFDELFTMPEGGDKSNVASSIEIPSISVSAKKDITKAVNDIKTAVKMLETNGYKVKVEEQDGTSEYKITITLGKDA